MNSVDTDAILRVEELATHFRLRGGALFKRTVGHLRALDGVSFELRQGETLGLVGESGCGKTTLARTLMRLEEPTRGTAYYRGRNIYELNKRELRDLRREIQIVFQDPYQSVDPRMRIGDVISEAWRIHPDLVPKRERRNRTHDLLERVGLDPKYVHRYAHQLSGGQRQRVGLARALAVNPKLLICDEPVSALDVSVQAQIINLLKAIQRDLGLSMIFIAHDLALVRQVCERVAVMYLGKIVEIGDVHQIYDEPSHPYTRALLSAVPVPDPSRKRDGVALDGEVPDLCEPLSGCGFRTRCREATARCECQEPELVQRPGCSHPCACHFPHHPAREQPYS